MGNDALIAKKNKITLLENEIKMLNDKEKELNELRKEYYIEYFNTDRDDYTLLTDIPDIVLNEKHVLFDHSALNVDEIGKLICELFYEYEHRKMISMRSYRYATFIGRFDRYAETYPILVIGDEKHVIENEKNDDNIIIGFDCCSELSRYPTDEPVIFNTFYYTFSGKKSNYNHLVGYRGGLSFDYKNYEFIKELIYSLAYYQKQHDISYMSPSDTRDVYRKIYKK